MKAVERRQKGLIRALGAVAAAATLIALLVACSGSSGSASGKSAQQSAQHGGPGGPGGRPGRGGPIPVQSQKVKNGTLQAQHVTAGTVVPVTQSQVAAQTSGVVAKVLHRAGDWVTSGAVVIQLDDSQLKLALDNAQVALKNAQINLVVGKQNAAQDAPKLQLQLQSAQAALSSAQKNYAAEQELYKAGGASSSQLDTAQSQLQTAQANVQAAQIALNQNQQAYEQNIAQLQLSVDQAQNQLKQAQLNLQNARIKAPFAGQIASVNVEVGEFVGQNTPAFLLVSADREVTFSVSPADAPALTPGHTVTFTMSGKTYDARVSQAPSAPVNGVVPLAATLTSAEQSLPYGSVGTVSYPVNLASGSLVPIPALQTSGTETYVYTIENGKAKQQPVAILAETADMAAVTQLTSSSEVIVSPPPGLLEGADVAPLGQQQSNQSGSGGTRATANRTSAGGGGNQ